MALFNLEDALTPGDGKDPGSLGKLEPPTQAALPVQGDVPPAMSAEDAQQEAAGFQRRKQAFDESKIREELRAAGLQWNPALGIVKTSQQGLIHSMIGSPRGDAYIWRDSSVSQKVDQHIVDHGGEIKDGWYVAGKDGKLRPADTDNPLRGYDAKLVRDPATGKPTMEIVGLGIWRSKGVTGQDLRPGFYGKDGKIVHDDKLPIKNKVGRAFKAAGRLVADTAVAIEKLRTGGIGGSHLAMEQALTGKVDPGSLSDNNVYANVGLSVVDHAANNMFPRNITTFMRNAKAEALDKVTNGLIDPKIGGIRAADVKKRLDELFYSQAEHGTEFARPYVDTDETYALSALLDTAGGKDVIPVRDIKRLAEAHHIYTRYRMENRTALTERNALAEANFTMSLEELSDLQFEMNSLRKEFPASELQQRVPPEMRDSYLSAEERLKAVQQKLSQAKELTPELESEFNAARNAYSSEALKVQRFRTKDKAKFDQILAKARSIRRGLRDDLEFLPENDKGQQRLIDAIESSEGKFGALAYDTALMLVGAGQAGRINAPSLFARSTAKNVLRRVGANVMKGAVRAGSQGITFKAGSGGLDVTAGAAMNAANPEADQGIAKQIAHDLGHEAAMLPFDMVLFSKWGHRISHRFSKTVPQILATQTIRAGALTTLSLGLSAAYTGIPLTPEQIGETALHFGAWELIGARGPMKEIGRWRDVLSKKHGAWMESFPSAEYARIPLMEAQEQLGSRLKALDAEAKKNPNDEAVRNDLKETRDKVLELSERWAAVEAAEKFGFAPWSQKQEAAKVEPGKPAAKEPAANAEPIPAEPTDRSGYDTALAPGLKTVREGAPSLARKAAPAPKREAPVDSDVYADTFKNGVRIYRDGADAFGVDKAESAKLIAEASKLFTSGSETGRADAIRMLNEGTMKLASEHAERLMVEPKNEPVAEPKSEEAKPKAEEPEPKAEQAGTKALPKKAMGKASEGMLGKPTPKPAEMAMDASRPMADRIAIARFLDPSVPEERKVLRDLAAELSSSGKADEARAFMMEKGSAFSVDEVKAGRPMEQPAASGPETAPRAEEAKPKEDPDFDIDLSALDSYDVPARALESMGEGTVDVSLKSKVEAIAEKDPNVKLAFDTRNTIRETIENLKKAGIDEKQLAPYYAVHRNASQTLKDALAPHGITFEKKAAAPAPQPVQPSQQVEQTQAENPSITAQPVTGNPKTATFHFPDVGMGTMQSLDGIDLSNHKIIARMTNPEDGVQWALVSDGTHHGWIQTNTKARPENYKQIQRNTFEDGAPVVEMPWDKDASSLMTAKRLLTGKTESAAPPAPPKPEPVQSPSKKSFTQRIMDAGKSVVGKKPAAEPTKDSIATQRRSIREKASLLMNDIRDKVQVFGDTWKDDTVNNRVKAIRRDATAEMERALEDFMADASVTPEQRRALEGRRKIDYDAASGKKTVTGGKVDPNALPTLVESPMVRDIAGDSPAFHKMEERVKASARKLAEGYASLAKHHSTSEKHRILSEMVPMLDDLSRRAGQMDPADFDVVQDLIRDANLIAKSVSTGAGIDGPLWQNFYRNSLRAGIRMGRHSYRNEASRIWIKKVAGELGHDEAAVSSALDAAEALGIGTDLRKELDRHLRDLAKSKPGAFDRKLMASGAPKGAEAPAAIRMRDRAKLAREVDYLLSARHEADRVLESDPKHDTFIEDAPLAAKRFKADYPALRMLGMESLNETAEALKGATANADKLRLTRIQRILGDGNLEGVMQRLSDDVAKNGPLEVTIRPDATEAESLTFNWMAGSKQRSDGSETAFDVAVPMPNDVRTMDILKGWVEMPGGAMPTEVTGHFFNEPSWRVQIQQAMTSMLSRPGAWSYGVKVPADKPGPYVGWEGKREETRNRITERPDVYGDRMPFITMDAKAEVEKNLVEGAQRLAAHREKVEKEGRITKRPKTRHRLRVPWFDADPNADSILKRMLDAGYVVAPVKRVQRTSLEAAAYVAEVNGTKGAKEMAIRVPKGARVIDVDMLKAILGPQMNDVALNQHFRINDSSASMRRSLEEYLDGSFGAEDGYATGTTDALRAVDAENALLADRRLMEVADKRRSDYMRDRRRFDAERERILNQLHADGILSRSDWMTMVRSVDDVATQIRNTGARLSITARQEFKRAIESELQTGALATVKTRSLRTRTRDAVKAVAGDEAALAFVREFFDPVGANGVDPGLKPSPRVKNARGRDEFSGPSTAQQMKAALKERYGIESIPEDAGWRNVSDVSGGSMAGAEDLKALALQHAALKAARRLTDERYRTSGDAEEVLIEAGQRRADEAAGEANELRASRDGLSPAEKGRLTREARKVDAAGELERQEAIGSAEIMQKAPRKVSDADALILGELAEGISFTPQEQRLVDLADSLGRKIGEPIVLPGDRAGTGDTLMPKDQIALVNPSHPEHVRVSRMVYEVFGQQPERNRYTEDVGTESGDAMRDLLAAAAEERAGGRFSGQTINFSSGSEGLRFTNSRGETKIVNLSQHREWVPEVVDGIHAELEKRGAGMFTSNDLITEAHRRLLPAISGDMNTQGIMRSIVTEAWRRTGQESRIQSYENRLSSIRNTIDKVADWSGHMAQRDTAFAEALHELGDTAKIGERVKKNRDGLRQFMEALDPRIVEGLTVTDATGKANANGAAGRYLNDTIELLKPAAVHAKALEMLDRFRPKAGTASRMEQRIDELMKRFAKGDTKWAEKASGAMVFEPKDWSLVDEADARALATRIAAAEHAGKGRLEVISTAAHEVQHWLETWTDGAVKQQKIALYEEARREFLASPEGVWHREFFEGDDAMFTDIRATISTKNALRDFADRVAAAEGELKAGGYNVEWNAKVYGVEMPTITTKEGRAVGMVDNNGAYRVSMDRAYYHFRNASEFSAVMGEHALRLASEQAGHGRGNLKSRLEKANSALDRAAAAAADEAMVLRDTMQAAGVSPVLLNHPEMRDLTFNVLADAIGPNRYTGWAKGGSTFEANGIDMREGGDLLAQMQGMSRGKAIEKTGDLYRKLFNLPESYDAGSPVTIEHFAKLDERGNIKWAGGFDGAKAVNDNMGVMLRKGIQSFISADSITSDTRHVAQLLTPQLMRVMALTQSDSVALGGTFVSDKGRAKTTGSVGPHLHFQRLALQDHSAPVIARIEAELAKKPNRVVDAQDAREAITVTIDDPQMPNSKMTYWVQTDPKSGKVTNSLSERMFDAWNYLESDGKAETTKLSDGDKGMLDHVRSYLRETNRQHIEAFSQIPGVNREALLELFKETDQLWISRLYTKQASGERSTRIHDQTYEIDNAVEDVMNPLNNNLMRSERGRLEQRRFETLGDAIKSGFLPKFQNPIEAALEGRRQLHNLMLFRAAISHMEDAGLMIRTTPDNVLDKNLYREIPLNMSADVKRALGLDSRGALLTDPELQSLRMGGQPDIRLWYKPEAGPLMNSIFGKGMSSNVWFRRLMDANAALNQVQLVGPFHMMVTAGYLKLGSIAAGSISDAAEWFYGQHRDRGAGKNDAVRKTLASLRSAGEIGGYLAGGEKLQNLLLDHGMKSYDQIHLDEKLTDFQKIALMAAQHGGVTPMRNTLNENHYASIREGYRANMENDGTAGAMARNAARNVGIGARTVQHGLNRLMTIQQGKVVAPAKLAFVLHNIAERVPKMYGEINAKTVERVMKDLRDPNSEFAKFALQVGDRADDIFGMANLKKLYLDPKTRDAVLALTRAFTWHLGNNTLFFKAIDETLQLSLGKHVRKGWGAVKTGVFGGEMMAKDSPRMASSFVIAHSLSTMTINGAIGMAVLHAFTTSDKTDSEDKIYKKAASFLYDLAFPVLSDGKGGKVRDRYGKERRVHVGYMKEWEDLSRMFKGDPAGFENLVFKGRSPSFEMGKAVVKSYADAEAAPGMRMGEPLGLPFGGQAIREKLESIDTSSTAGKLHDRTVRAGVEVAKQLQPMSISSYRRAMNEKTDQGEDLHWFAKLLLTGGYRYVPMEHPNEKGEFKH